MKTPRPYIEAALASIAAILSYTPSTEDEFLSDQKTQDAVLMRLQDLGENLSRVRQGFPDFWDAHQASGWNEVVGLRHLISHEYGQVRLDLIWVVIEKNLADLRDSLQQALSAEPQ